ncbi:hypothetical protein ACFLU2_00940 [Chloroflexota bacterium]
MEKTIKIAKRYLIVISISLALIVLLLPPAVLAGTPDDSYTIGRYHREEWAQSTTTLATWQDKTVLTFTPPSTGYYLLISDCVISTGTARDQVKARFIEGSTTYDEIVYDPKQNNSESSFTVHRVFNLIGGDPYTFKNQYASVVADDTSRIRDATLTAIQLSTNDTIEHLGPTTTTNGSYTDVTTLNFTGDGSDYLIIASADISNSITSKEVYTQLYYSTGTAPWGECIFSPLVADDLGNFFMFRKLSSASGAQQFKIQYYTSGGTASIQNARITAVKLTDLSDVQYDESEGVSSDSTGVAFIDKASITDFTPVAEGNYSVSMVSLIAQSSTSGEVDSAETIDGTPFDIQIYSPDDTATYIPSGHSDVFPLDKTPHTIKTQFKQVSTGIAYMKNSRIIAMRVNTCESYSNSTHTTVPETFNDSADTLYFWANGLTQSEAVETPTSYKVAYYDGDGIHVTTDTSDSTLYGNISTTYVLNDNQSAAAGTWHAAVFTSTATPPGTWGDVTGTSGFVMYDAFEVAASAIPEFSTVMTGIAVVGMCLGIYCWMRKRKTQYVKA